MGIRSPDLFIDLVVEHGKQLVGYKVGNHRK